MVEDKQIIVCAEKHDTVYWDAITPEAWATSALKILTERWQDGYWYPDPEAYRPKDLLTDEQINALPTEELRVDERRRQKAKVAQQLRYAEYAAWYAKAKRVVEAQDLSWLTLGRGQWARQIPEAWDLLDQRSDHEYEAVSLETLHG